MNVLRLIWAEIRDIITNRRVLIPVLGVLFIPLLYSSLFLWAFWNPYGKLNALPVAVVNQDSGAVFDGKSIHVGADLVTQLKDNPKFAWQFVNLQTAEQGFKNNQYYMTIVVPSDFSKEAMSVMDPQPVQAKLTYNLNDSYNYLSSQISHSAMISVKDQLDQSLTKAYAKVLLQDMSQISHGLSQAGQGATEINQGLGKVNAGADLLALREGEMQTGIGVVDQKLHLAMAAVTHLGQGEQQVAAGTNSLANGLVQLSSQVSGGISATTNGVTQLQTGLHQAVTQAQTLTQAQESAASGVSTLQQGLTQLSKAAQGLQQGATQNLSGARDVASGFANQSAAITNLSAASQQLLDSVQQLQQSAAVRANPQLAEALSQLMASSTAINNGLYALNTSQPKLANGVSQLVTGQDAMSSGLNQFASQLKLTADGSQKLVTGQSQLVGAVTQFQGGLGQLATGVDKYAAAQAPLLNGLNQLGAHLTDAASASRQLQSGQLQLAAGAQRLSSGMQQLTAGTDKLVSGSSALTQGAQQLASGVKPLQQGSQQLASQLISAADKTGAVKLGNATYDAIADPVNLVEKTRAGLPNYGSGFTPYFVSLGLYVGALVLSIVWSMNRPSHMPKTALGWLVSKAAVLAIVGVIQASLVDAIVLGGLHLHVASPFAFWLLSVTSSISFLVLIQFLISAFSNAGRFIAIAILILQLTTSAGTFPLQVIPNFLQHFNKWLPMTYTVGGFRAIIAGQWSYMWTNITQLLVFPLISVLLTFIVFLMYRRLAKGKFMRSVYSVIEE